MKKSFTIISENFNRNYSSVTLSYNKNKFKVVAKYGNGYNDCDIYMFTPNGWAHMYEWFDIPGLVGFTYGDSDEGKFETSKKNIETMITFITKVF